MASDAGPDSNLAQRAFRILDAFQIEIPSWGFANTGTRFGKFMQAAAATTIDEKFSDAAEVHRLTRQDQAKFPPCANLGSAFLENYVGRETASAAPQYT